jgi:hypothetical protein
MEASAKVWRGASGPGRTSTFLVIPVVTGLTRGATTDVVPSRK